MKKEKKFYEINISSHYYNTAMVTKQKIRKKQLLPTLSKTAKTILNLILLPRREKVFRA